MEVHVSVYSLFDGEEAVVAREVATLARQAAEAWVTVAATVTARL